MELSDKGISFRLPRELYSELVKVCKEEGVSIQKKMLDLVRACTHASTHEEPVSIPAEWEGDTVVDEAWEGELESLRVKYPMLSEYELPHAEKMERFYRKELKEKRKIPVAWFDYFKGIDPKIVEEL